MPGKIFIDTNIWVYLFLKSKNPVDRIKRNKIEKLLMENPSIAISTQVLNEFVNVLVKKYGITTELISDFIKQILKIAEINYLTEDNTLKALLLIDKYSLSFYDALIITSALDSECKVLLTEDMQQGFKVDGKIQIVNPFN